MPATTHNPDPATTPTLPSPADVAALVARLSPHPQTPDDAAVMARAKLLRDAVTMITTLHASLTAATPPQWPVASQTEDAKDAFATDPTVTLDDLRRLADSLRPTSPCTNCKGIGKADFLGIQTDCPHCDGTGQTRPSFPRLLTGLQMPDMATMLNAVSFGSPPPGTFVAVRPIDGDQTHLGLFLGNFATSVTGGISQDGTLVLRFGLGNPAIWVPALNRIVRGYESWWGDIESPDRLRQITNEDIDNVWYVQALRQMETTSTPPASNPGNA